jgi:hypothetical protein
MSHIRIPYTPAGYCGDSKTRSLLFLLTMSAIPIPTTPAAATAATTIRTIPYVGIVDELDDPLEMLISPTPGIFARFNDETEGAGPKIKLLDS